MTEARVFNGEVSIAERAADARRRLERDGVNVSNWARERNFSVKLTHNVLSGTRACNFGQSHRIAVALGIKPSPACANG